MRARARAVPAARLARRHRRHGLLLARHAAHHVSVCVRVSGECVPVPQCDVSMCAQVRGGGVGAARRHAGGARQRPRAVAGATGRYHDVLPRHLRARLSAHRRALLATAVSLHQHV